MNGVTLSVSLEILHNHLHYTIHLTATLRDLPIASSGVSRSLSLLVSINTQRITSAYLTVNNHRLHGRRGSPRTEMGLMLRIYYPRSIFNIPAIQKLTSADLTRDELGQ